MTNKVYDINTAESLIAGTESAPCKKCGESNWSKAAPSNQTKKQGMLTVRCLVCASTASSAYMNNRYANDPAYRDARNAASLALNKERRENDPEWREARNAQALALNKARYANDPVYREAKKAHDLAWKKENPGKCNAQKAKRRAAEKHATPRWVDPKEFDLIYINCPPEHHVDHYYPLVGPKNRDGKRIGCGFHAPINLQYLPASENLRKSNKWPAFILPRKLWRFYTWKL